MSSAREIRSDSAIGPVPVRYRCDFVARNALDLVTGMGGRLVDLAMAGWQVTAVLADCPDPLPLRVLGAAVVDLDWLDAGPGNDLDPRMLTVASEICGDVRVRRALRCALGRPDGAVAVWGRGGTAGLDSEYGRTLSPTRHRLSAAGRAFKASALVALRETPVFEPTEAYWATASECDDIHPCI
ncbi:hypothetical protein [Mycobacterium malmoense]|uniref:hypothetical protein n=1 Tax=Mycobacterium malmoense TaxID=1780 RepID=UPI00114625AD|nr:hypothetical protein [Mycobacterium malmoense]